ncbi:MAG TPA: hypothetical protein VMX13_09855 [Sedimentisphaerales bacterium]|nr:hypothetical protein [Sedimentisphaerales bacterium]
MDMSKLKEAYKSYSSLLKPFFILLAGAIVLVPTQLISRNLGQKVQRESVSTGKDMQALEVFPSRQWEEEKKRQDAFERDANEIDRLARQSTQRQLLSYAIFPKPKDESVFIFGDFGRKFRGAVDQLIARMNAGDCPTQDELDKFRKSPKARRALSVNLTEVDAAIEDNLCREKAERASVYARADDLDGYDFWAEYGYAKAKSRDEAVRNCWYSQLAYWIIEDVVHTVGVLNSGSSSVLTSPVKRLLSVNFPMIVTGGRTKYVSTGSRKDKEQDSLPSYLVSPKYGLATPHTARICDGDIDVVHFKIQVVVSTKAVLSFMQELCRAKEHEFKGWDGTEPEQIFKHNQITILRYTIDSVKRDGGAHSLYRYGEDAVVKLEVICEYIFDASTYDQVKPQAVKDTVEEELNEMQKQKAKTTRTSKVKTSGTTGKTKPANKKISTFDDI